MKLYFTIKPIGICSYSPSSLSFLNFTSEKEIQRILLVLIALLNRCCENVFKQWSTELGYHIPISLLVCVKSPYRYCLHLILSTPIEYTPDVMSTGQVLWLVVVKRSIKQERYKSKAEHISYIYILATNWRRPHSCSALIDDCWPSKETFFEMLACNYDERTVKKW